MELAIFLFTRRVLAFFRVNPAQSFNQPDFFIRGAWFDRSSGHPRMNPGKQEGGGAKTIEESASFLFEVSRRQRRPLDPILKRVKEHASLGSTRYTYVCVCVYPSIYLYLYLRRRRSFHPVYERIEKHAPLCIAHHGSGAALGEDLSIYIYILETIYIHLPISISILTSPPVVPPRPLASRKARPP